MNRAIRHDHRDRATARQAGCVVNREHAGRSGHDATTTAGARAHWIGDLDHLTRPDHHASLDRCREADDLGFILAAVDQPVGKPCCLAAAGAGEGCNFLADDAITVDGFLVFSLNVIRLASVKIQVLNDDDIRPCLDVTSGIGEAFFGDVGKREQIGRIDRLVL